MPHAAIPCLRDCYRQNEYDGIFGALRTLWTTPLLVLVCIPAELALRNASRVRLSRYVAYAVLRISLRRDCINRVCALPEALCFLLRE
jgi:hypothetical protein